MSWASATYSYIHTNHNKLNSFMSLRRKFLTRLNLYDGKCHHVSNILKKYHAVYNMISYIIIGKVKHHARVRKYNPHPVTHHVLLIKPVQNDQRIKMVLPPVSNFALMVTQISRSIWALSAIPLLKTPYNHLFKHTILNLCIKN